MKKVITWIIILALIGGGIAAYLWWRGEQAATQQSSNILRTGQVTRGDLSITVVASGNVAVKNKLDLRFDSAGIVDHVYVQVNQRVQTGEVLAQLATTDLERAIQQATIALEQATLNRNILTKPPSAEDMELARLNVQSTAQALEVARIGKQTAQVDANAMIVQAQRARESAYNDYSNRQSEDARLRFQNAEEQEYIARKNAEVTQEQAQAQWLAAYNRYQQAVESLRRLEAGPEEQQIRQAELQIEQAQLNLEQAQARLNDARLTAPFAGLIAAVNVQEGVQASPGTTAFTLVDDSQFYVDVTVDEIDIGKVSIGQTAEVTLDAYPDSSIDGVVESIAPGALNVGGIISYRLRMQLFPPPVPPDEGDVRENLPPDGGDVRGGVIRDGMTASIVIYTDLAEDVLLAPNWAVRSDQSTGETILYCYVLRGDDVPERRTITRGRYNETFTEILSGLQAGDTVALVSEERNLLDLMMSGGQ
ncbi:MAG: efflux RND transporter periplasmic adaptor subunit [Anaerolineae bacterium]|nr:efflux RND transporter periplasmic adaptor subunit [Anaerolineae bacterium]